MPGVPLNFQAISNVLPTYNFVDIISGTGYVNFYAGDTVDKKMLSNYTYYSDVGITSTSNSNFDVDFDIVLNRPMDIKGIGIVQIPAAAITSSQPMTMYLTVYFRKVTGGVESDIISNISRTINTTVDNTRAYSMLSVDLDIPLTHFKIGDTIRLSFVSTYASAGNVYCLMAYDPKGRTTGWDTTGAVPSQLIFQCPVRLNL
jgi:hypothetical protein